MPSRRSIKDTDDEDDRDRDEESDVTDGGDKADDEREEEKEAPRRKASRVPGRTKWQRFKAWFRDTRLYLYALFFLGSFLLFVLGVLGIWFPRAFGPGLESWFRGVGAYNSWLFFGGFIAILSAAYLFLTLIFKRAEFHRLVSTKSKGDFVHSLDRIERLAFELGSHENEVVAARKREFRIRH